MTDFDAANMHYLEQLESVTAVFVAVLILAFVAAVAWCIFEHMQPTRERVTVITATKEYHD